MAVRKEYRTLALVTIFLGVSSGMAIWAGLFTNAKIQLNEARCETLSLVAIKTFNDQPTSSWKPAGAQIREITEVSEAAAFRANNGDIMERRCRGNALMADDTRARVSFKLYENEGKALPIVGIGRDGEMRVFRRG